MPKDWDSSRSKRLGRSRIQTSGDNSTDGDDGWKFVGERRTDHDTWWRSIGQEVGTIPIPDRMESAWTHG